MDFRAKGAGARGRGAAHHRPNEEDGDGTGTWLLSCSQAPGTAAGFSPLGGVAVGEGALGSVGSSRCRAVQAKRLGVGNGRESIRTRERSRVYRLKIAVCRRYVQNPPVSFFKGWEGKKKPGLEVFIFQIFIGLVSVLGFVCLETPVPAGLRQEPRAAEAAASRGPGTCAWSFPRCPPCLSSHRPLRGARLGSGGSTVTPVFRLVAPVPATPGAPHPSGPPWVGQR